MPGMNDGCIPERKQDSVIERISVVVVAARQIGAPNRSREQRVADEEMLPAIALRPICRQTPPGQWPGV